MFLVKTSAPIKLCLFDLIKRKNCQIQRDTLLKAVFTEKTDFDFKN